MYVTTSLAPGDAGDVADAGVAGGTDAAPLFGAFVVSSMFRGITARRVVNAEKPRRRDAETPRETATSARTNSYKRHFPPQQTEFTRTMPSRQEMTNNELLHYAAVLARAKERERDWLYGWGAGRYHHLRLALEYALATAQAEITSRALVMLDDSDVSDDADLDAFELDCAPCEGVDVATLDCADSYLDANGELRKSQNPRRRPWMCRHCLWINDGNDGRCTRRDERGERFICATRKPIDDALQAQAPWVCLQCAGLNFGRRKTCHFGRSRSCGVPRDGNEWVP